MATRGLAPRTRYMLLRAMGPPRIVATAFQYALENGADFICVGMFDFQVKEDVTIVKNVLNDLASKKLNRVRSWKA